MMDGPMEWAQRHADFDRHTFFTMHNEQMSSDDDHETLKWAAGALYGGMLIQHSR